MSGITSILKRNGERVAFDKKRILIAIEKAFLSEGKADMAVIAMITDQVVQEIISRYGKEPLIQVELVQDMVEEMLMRGGYHQVAKNFILYRAERAHAREEEVLSKIQSKTLEIVSDTSGRVIFDSEKMARDLAKLGHDLEHIDYDAILTQVYKQIYEGISDHDIQLLLLSATRERIERHYNYSFLSSRILLQGLYQDILSVPLTDDQCQSTYQAKFPDYIQQGVDLELLSPELLDYDLQRLSRAILPKRDRLFQYLGVQVLVDRYFQRDRSAERNVIELPQWFWMRVAMGLAAKESEKETKAIEFYHVLSQLDLLSSTPTLFNSGTLHSQMSSCYINIVDDSLTGIFSLYDECAQLSKWAGGIGTDWTPIRATGSKIQGTNGQSQGVIPFIKIYNDVALAVNQGGKRKGAMCAYMEVWHKDFEQFLELKKNTGDERRRAHDINTASWIPDLFMKRVQENGEWTLFCPTEVPDLHDLYGQDFEERYAFYETQNLSSAKTMKASDLWRKMLTMLYETGHPWMTFKDAVNVRNPQDHVGVVHSSNLCTEITLNTSNDETAVCNLASINLGNMISDGQLDEKKVKATVTTAIRMLDNVIDNNYYPTENAARANLRHRAVGLGLMGYQDALYQLDINFDSQANVEFADRSQEMISYYAISASSDLAKERGSYESFEGSKWARGIFPFDTLLLLQENRGEALSTSMETRMDWDTLKRKVQAQGMRNSNTMAIAPTATIANIAGVFPCTEPAFKNIYMKENLSGNFVVINRHLVDDLMKLGLWNEHLLNEIKLNDGSLAPVVEIPEHIKAKYKEVFEIDASWIIQAASRRSKWIDQSASTNIFVATTSGKQLNEIYFNAWKSGLKTTYYLRALGATQVQKMGAKTTSSSETPEASAPESPSRNEKVPVLCSIENPDCEACQ